MREMPIQYRFDISVARPFSVGHFNTPPVPVLAAFKDSPLHACEKHGSWDVERVAREKSALIVRSYLYLSNNKSEHGWQHLILQMGPTSFICINEPSIYAYAATAAEAEQMAVDFNKEYATTPVSFGSFYLIRSDRDTIASQAVDLVKTHDLSDDHLDLNYGNDMAKWHHHFTNILCTKINGLSIFEGPPGTGKTSYLRHLMGLLKDTHRFYFIPPNYLYLLTQTQFIGFWASERQAHRDRQFVVILEDSEAVLMTRAADNRDEVSAILNLSDGMLADFLRLQIICTINCHSSKLDEALLRPGRLVSHRLFKRLDYGEATRLAQSLGNELPINRDYSLAEIFAGSNNEQTSRPRIGF